jgi:tight adherence protein C
MSMSIIAGAALVSTALPVAWWAVSGRSTAAAVNMRRGLSVLDVRATQLSEPAGERVVRPLFERIAAQSRRVTPAGMLDSLDEALTSSGMEGRWTLEQILAVKLLLGASMGLVGLLQLAASPSPLTFVAVAILTMILWTGPDRVLRIKAELRRQTMQQELPDVMDQVTIAVEAGLGFEAALARVAAAGDGEVAGELTRTLQDIQLGVPRAEALDGMAERTKVPEIRHFVSSIRQAERYGLPIANVLRIQSSELREKRRQRAEEHAMKVPVKVLFPLIFCILPSLFVVILGPAVIRVAHSGLGG